jgi:PKD repeat protein
MLRFLVVCLTFLPAFLCAQSAPEEFGGLQLWLRSDTGVVTTDLGKVETWADLSGNDNHAFQNTNNFRPNLFEDVLLGYPSIAFDGVNDWLNFPELNDIRTVFWVIREHDDATISGRCLLGHDSQFDFFRGPNYNIWHGDFTNANVLGGTTRLNFSEIDGVTTTVPHDFSILSVVTTGNTNASRITLDRSLFTNVWDGELLELAIYNEALEPEEVESVEAYFAARYSPEFSVSDDVLIEYGFCDTTICASPGFQSYLWSTGESEPCISVNNTDDYWVQVTDSFGRLVTDTVEVQFPGVTNIPNQFICAGDEVLIDTELDDEFYDVSWNGELGLPSLSISAGGNYVLQVSDTLGCSLTADTIVVEEDLFPLEANLGGDAALCEGNELMLLAEGYEVTSYLWNDDSEEMTLAVSTSGEYWIEATDIFDCIAQDTIVVDIVGTAPTLDFSAEELCFGDLTQFLNESTSENTIETWLWDFDDGQFDSSQNPAHEYAEIGDFEVFLQATTDVGCTAEYSETIHIYQVPEADFTQTLLCAGWTAQFLDASTSDEGQLILWEWVIDGETYSSSDVGVILDEPGFESVTLEVTTAFGCSDIEQRLVEVLPSPEVSVLSEGNCLEQLVEFEAEVDDQGSGDIETYFWEFGDGTVSFEPSPDHIYFFAGSQFVSITITAENGCQAVGFSNLEIYLPPQADFFVENLCVDEPYTIVDMSFSAPDSIAEWDWVIEDYGTAIGPAPEVVFDEMGFYQVELTVTTQHGCSATSTQTFPVFEPPTAAFSYDPIIQAPPAEITFTNLSSGIGLLSDWDFDGGISTGGSNPVVTFEEAGVYTVTLGVTNDVGCSATTSIDILIDDPIQDLVIQNVICEETDAGLQLWVSVSNQGNFRLDEVDLFWYIAGETPAHEVWQGDLPSGGLMEYQFTSGPVPGVSSESVLCIEAQSLYTGVSDANPDDNDYCKALEAIEEMTVLPLWPNPAGGELVVDLMLPKAGEFTLLIHDSRGRKVVETEPISGLEGFNRITLGVGQLLQATYYLEVRSETDVEVLGFMKD